MHTKLLSKTKSELIELIKRKVEISVDEGADSLDLATTTVRQHLTSLEKKGLIKTRSQRHGRGRPRLIYSLTQTGQEFFEEHDQEFLSGLLEFLDSKGLGHLVNEYIEQLGERLTKQIDLEGADTGERISSMFSFLRRRGFMPELDETPDGDTLLILRHCPYRTVAECSEQVCDVEERWIKKIWGADVERSAHRLHGADACSYCLHSDET